MLTAIKTYLRKNDSISHVFMALLGFVLVFTPLAVFSVANAHWIAAFTMIGAYYGRERRDYEYSTGRSINETSFEIGGYFPWNWKLDGQRDFGYPLMAMMLLGAIITYFTYTV